MNASDETPEPLSTKGRTKALDDLLRRHTGQLAEHFSSVQIVATRLEEDGSTTGFAKGAGDYYARRGVSQEWLKLGRYFDTDD